LKQTIDPDPGYAVKELFFTQNDEAYFAILPQWNSEITIRNFKALNNTKITLLATNEVLKGKQVDDDFVITLPVYKPKLFKETDSYAFVLKITK
jgi:alpha-L-fucosidase